MPPRDSAPIITRAFTARLVLRLFIIFACGGAVAALLLYTAFQQPCGASYSASLSTLTEVKNTLTTRSIYIHLFSFVLIGVGVAIFCVRYSHRVVGPMIRLQRLVKNISAGDLSETIYLRKNDVLHPISEQLNGMLREYRQSLAEVESRIGEIRRLTEEVRSGAEDRQMLRQRLAAISSASDEIKKKMILLNNDII